MKRSGNIAAALLLLLALSSCRQETEQSMDLAGEWNVALDREDKGTADQWYNSHLAEPITLPGSLAENGVGDDISVHTRWTSQIVDSSWYFDEKYAPYREEGNIKIPFWLQPEKRYVGAAWYQKEIVIPEKWSDKHLVLHLERPHWETKLWIDGREIGQRNSLGTPHVYHLEGHLDPGKHTVTLRIDNRIKEVDPGINSHSIADHTQSNWNGLAGAITLRALPMVHIGNVALYPDIQNSTVKALIEVRNHTGNDQSCQLQLKCIQPGTGDQLKSVVHKFSMKGNEESRDIEIIYPMGASPALWDEFDPNLYQMALELKSAQGIHQQKVAFGMREFKTEGKRFTINGRPTFLRGTLECAIFPRTGYPATGIDDWEKIMTSVKAHGLNHIRFHSWCPPEAAFDAADRLGVYLHVECSSWANSGSSIGDGKPVDR